MDYNIYIDKRVERRIMAVLQAWNGGQPVPFQELQQECSKAFYNLNPKFTWVKLTVIRNRLQEKSDPSYKPGAYPFENLLPAEANLEYFDALLQGRDLRNQLSQKLRLWRRQMGRPLTTVDIRQRALEPIQIDSQRLTTQDLEIIIEDLKHTVRLIEFKDVLPTQANSAFFTVLLAEKIRLNPETYQPRKPLNIKNKLASLDFKHIIGGPLKACVEAQEEAAQATYDYITASLMEKDKDDVADFKPVMMHFYFIMNGSYNELSIPLMSILPIPYMNIEHVDLNFQAEVTFSDKSKSNDKYELKACYPVFRDATNIDTTTQSDITVRQNIDIKLRASTIDQPVGISKLIQVLGNEMSRFVQLSPTQDSPTT